MAQTVLITLTTAGADTGPFDLYSNIDGYTIPFENNVSKAALEAGYVSSLVPDSASIVRVQSDNVLCGNFIDLIIITTTTTSSTSTTTSSTSTTTTSSTSTTTSTTTTDPCEGCPPAGPVSPFEYCGAGCTGPETYFQLFHDGCCGFNCLEQSGPCP